MAKPVQPTQVLTPTDAQTVMPPVTSAPAGLSAAEYNDRNRIIVSVIDKETPVVVLYGPPACGKTMTLVRMTRYLKQQGLTVEPVRTFRPSDDTNYQTLCDNFDQTMSSPTAAASTSNISFMLVQVLRDGKPLCQILEAPGEYYFNPQFPDQPYPAYVNAILGSQNRKVWAIMVEPDWADTAPRNNYVTRIADLARQKQTRDKVLFIFNKIDKTSFVLSAGQVNTREAIRHVQNLYPGIFVPFRNVNPLTKWLTPYRCEFLPFMTGRYSQTMDGGLTYTEGDNIYVRNLWKAILKLTH